METKYLHPVILLLCYHSIIHQSEGSYDDCSLINPSMEPMRRTSSQGCLEIPPGARTSAGYKNDRLCRWEIETPEGTIAHLEFLDFDLEAGVWGACIYDHVTVMDPSSGEVSVYCGSPTNIPTVVGSGNKILVTFSSDSSVNSRGFNATFWSTPEGSAANSPPSMEICSSSSETEPSSSVTETEPTTSSPSTTSTILDALTSAVTESGSLSSTCPSLPSSTFRIETASPYSNTQMCTWTIEAPPGKRILVEFVSFDVEHGAGCRYDALTFYDAPTETNRLVTLCGSMLPQSIVSSSSFMSIAFRSDASVTAAGVVADYRFFDQEETLVCEGNVILTDAHGNFGSTDESMYSNHASCSWTISVPESQSISLHFIYLAIEYHSSCLYDSLIIYDGDSPSSPEMTRKCGYAEDYNITSSSNSITIVFTSDASIVDSGFKAWYTSSGPTTSTTTTLLPDSPDATSTAVASSAPYIPSGSCGRHSGYTGISRIVNGEVADAYSWPWQVSLQTNSNFHFCGGSIIARDWVISAAHCVEGKSPGSFKIVVGAHDLAANGGASDGQVATVLSIHMHPMHHEGGRHANDMVLLHLDTPLDFNSRVTPVCLPTVDISPGISCTITGWGTLYSGGPSPSVLMEGNVTTRSNEECSSSGYGSLIKPSMLCAGSDAGAANPVDSCQGDSGGPLVCAHGEGDDLEYDLYGITSWGFGCATNYGVYARVYSLLDWIHSIIQAN